MLLCEVRYVAQVDCFSGFGLSAAALIESHNLSALNASAKLLSSENGNSAGKSWIFSERIDYL